MCKYKYIFELFRNFYTAVRVFAYSETLIRQVWAFGLGGIIKKI